MARRADPERIYAAQREGNRQRLMAGGAMSPETAEGWIAAWEKRAADEGVVARGHVFWDAGWEWIAAERRLRRRP
jgi:hypothetical protein